MTSHKISEAATIKARVLRLSRELGSLLQDKQIPEGLKKTIESFQSSLKKTWKELEAESGQEKGRKGVAGAESAPGSGDALSEFWDEGEFKYIPPHIISFSQLEAAEAAKEIGEDIRERVGQFEDMLNNIFFWASDQDIPDRLGAASTLFDEFISVMSAILSGPAGDSMLAAGESGSPDSPAPAGAEAIGESLAESYATPSVRLIEADGATDPRSPLELDLQIIRPGWGNRADNHYYPAEMLRRDAGVFEGVKMYVTDHRAEEKNVKTEVSQIKRIVGFTEDGAPIGRVVIFDPDFAEATRNRAKAGVLESLECSILADGKARPGFERDGRKGKIVESIVAASSVDWVTRAGAGGKALNLVESDAGSQIQESEDLSEENIGETDPPAAIPVSIHEATDETAPPAPDDQAPALEENSVPVSISREEIAGALRKVNLPGASILDLMERQYPTAEALAEAIQSETSRIKEITGSGRPFAMGESARPNSDPVYVPVAERDATITRINKKYIGG